MVVKLVIGDICSCDSCYMGVDCVMVCNGYGKCE